MKFFTLEHDASCPSFVIADEGTQQAAVVNPQPDLETYVRLAEEHGWQLRYIFVPNVSRQLDYAKFALRTGGRLYVFDADEALHDGFNLVRSGDVIEFGNVRLAVQPPVDRASCMSLLVYDLSVSDRTPRTVLGRDLPLSSVDPVHAETPTNHVGQNGIHCQNG